MLGWLENTAALPLLIWLVYTAELLLVGLGWLGYRAALPVLGWLEYTG